MNKLVTIFFVLFATSALAQEKANARRFYEQGEMAYDAGKYAAALELFNQCLRENPAYAEAYIIRAATREQLKDLAGANTDYSIYLEMKPDEPEVILSRATVRYQLGKYQEAKEDFMRLLTLPAGITNTVYFQKSASVTGTRQIMTAQGNTKPLLYNYLGLAETKLKNYRAAITWLDSAIQLEGKEADYYVNRGIAKEGALDTTALVDYQKALAINPEHTLALHNMAVLKRRQGRKIESYDRLEEAIGTDSSMLYPYLERAYQRLEGGYYKGALEDYNRALSIEDKDPDIWVRRGIVKEKLNDLKGAYSDYTKAIDLKENSDKAWLNRGNVLSKQGKYKEAVEDYTVAIIYNAESAAAFYNRAIAHQKNGRLSEACEDLKKAESLGMLPSERMKKEFCK